MLEINNLSVDVLGRKILKDVYLIINPGDTAILFGPNGSGKSTLIKTILGLKGYSVARGTITFNGTALNSLPTEERVNLGIGVMYQHPPKIRGVTLRQIARFLSNDEQKIGELADRLSLQDHLDRDINLNFSGGEVKRSELFQVLLQDPELILLDEPESGVDLENISIMGEALRDFLRQEGKSALIITHTGYVLDYIESNKGCVLLEGSFRCFNNPKAIFTSIRKSGYEKCVVCDDGKEPC